ncbi:helix-turn-helix domain-containing protein [Pontibacter toksunensis]|uniref:Helix-turn-helix domain-containing protein n=1 Tax=Pontibacter toksunensis TaxID=1332631 RepID=A0ABW6C2U9_9BACT
MKHELKLPHDLLIYLSADEFIERVAQRVVQLQRESGPAPSDCYLEKKDEDPIDTGEVCRVWNLSRKTVEERRKDGTFPFFRIGRKVYFFRSEVLAAMEKPKRLPGSSGTGKQNFGKTPFLSKAA